METYILLGVSFYVASFFVVAGDRRHYRRMSELYNAVPKILLNVLPIALFAWLVYTDFQILRDYNRYLDNKSYELEAHRTLTGIPFEILLKLFGIAYVIVAILAMLLLAAISLICTGVLMTIMVPILPTLVMLPFLATPTVGLGFVTVAKVPFVMVRQLVYFFLRPPSLSTIKRVTRAADARPEDIASAARNLCDEFEHTIKSSRYQRPNIVIKAYEYHLRKFADGLARERLSKARVEALNSYAQTVRRTGEEMRSKIEDLYQEAYGDQNDRKKTTP